MITLFVCNISYWAEEADVRELFERFGKVQRVKLLIDHRTGKSRGKAYVDFPDRVQGEQAIRELDGGEWGGRTLGVREAEDRTRTVRYVRDTEAVCQ